MKNKQPAIRFKGFTEDWEQHKLSEVVNRLDRKNTNLESTLPLTISAQYGLVDQITYFNNRVASRDISNYYLLKKGEFAYNKSYSDGYPFGVVKRLDLYEMGVLSTLYIVFSLKENIIDSDFLVSYYDTDNWHEQIAKRATEGARNHGLLNISATDFLETELKLATKKKEQKKIGEFFKQLDNLINLYQRKYDKLVNIKKSLLEKMLPKGDSNAPAIRFKGFTENWEQYKLNEISTSFEYGLNVNAIEFDGLNKYIRITDIDDKTRNLNTNYLTTPNIDLKLAEKYKLSIGDILFARTGASVGKTYIYKNSDGLVYYAGFLIRARIKTNFDTEFIFQNTLTNKYNSFIKITSQRSGQPGVNAQEYSNFKIMIPNFNEQNKIGEFFKQIDNLINLYQRKIEKLQNIKKFCLDKMFV